MCVCKNAYVSHVNNVSIVRSASMDISTPILVDCVNGMNDDDDVVINGEKGWYLLRVVHIYGCKQAGIPINNK